MAEQFARERLPDALQREPAPQAEREPALTLGECIDLYAALRDQAQMLEDLVRTLRDQIIELMVSRDLEEIQHGRFEVVRQVRRTPPKLDIVRATEILKRHHRLDECLIPTLDTEKARKVLDELRAQGLISKRELPLEPSRTVEALVVRPVAGTNEQPEGR